MSQWVLYLSQLLNLITFYLLHTYTYVYLNNNIVLSVAKQIIEEHQEIEFHN